MKTLILLLSFFNSFFLLASENFAANSKVSLQLNVEGKNNEILADAKMRATLCPELARRLSHQNGLMSAGPFATARCGQQKNGEHADWVLSTKEENQKLNFIIEFNNQIKAKIYLESGGLTAEFLTSFDVLELVAFGLNDQLPFLGYVDKKNVVNKEKILLQYVKPSPVNEFLPTNLVFYDLNPIAKDSSLSSHVRSTGDVKQVEGQYIIQGKKLVQNVNSTNFVWFHASAGLGIAGAKIQKKLLDLQNEARRLASVKSTPAIRKYLLARIGKQVLTQYALQSKAWLLGLASEFGNETMRAVQFSYDYSPKVANDSGLGEESQQWQKLTLGKAFTKNFDSRSFDVTPKLKLLNYQGNIKTALDDQDAGISSFEVKNSISLMLEVGAEQRFTNDWLRISYGYGFSPVRFSSTRVLEHQAGLYYFHPFSHEGASSSVASGQILLHFFTEFISSTLNNASETDADTTLKSTTLFIGSGLGVQL